ELNAYAYVRNNPTSRVDPFGLESGDIWSGWMDKIEISRLRSNPPACQPRCNPQHCGEQCFNFANPPWWTTPWIVPFGMAFTKAGTAAGGWGMGTATMCWWMCSIDPCIMTASPDEPQSFPYGYHY